MKKYILLLVSVFAFGQASNQMVTFTEAQSLGFPLKSGQSHVTSNQCMTKSDALAKYNVDADAMSSYAENQLVPRSVWVNAVWVFNIGTTYTPQVFHNENTDGSCVSCAYPNQLTTTFYAKQSTITNGMVLYSDAGATVPVTGYASNTQFYENGRVFTISQSGVVSAITPCTVGFSEIRYVANTQFTTNLSGTLYVHSGSASFSAFAQSTSSSPVYVDITIDGITRSITSSGTGMTYSTAFSLPTGNYSFSIKYTQTDEGQAYGGIHFQ